MSAAAPAGGRRAALAFIFVTILLDMFALGLVIPVLPRLDRGLPGGRHRGCGAHLRPVRHRLGGDAVPVHAGDGRAFRSLRAPPRHPALEPRPRPVLRADGARAGTRLAVRRARDLGHHRRERQHGHGLRGRRDSGRGTCRRVRPHGHRHRARLRARSGARRAARQRRSAAAVLGCRRAEPRERGLRHFRAARVAPARAASGVRVATRQPARFAHAAALEPRTDGAGRRDVPGQHRARGAARHVRAVRGLPLRLGCARRRFRARGGRRVLGAGAGRRWSVPWSGASASGACCSPA